MDLNDPEHSNRITAVLLPDGWHKVLHNSFEIEPWNPADALGFSFLTGSEEISGPLTSVLAISQA
ncbi:MULTISPECIES: hypothetical protein [Gordonia]|uniref:Uncharacterized protein n=1 Tax=Gordonia sputi NBRC 100414 TaxID=1089453 RepID=H5TYF1_9ACTN|nr:MULTISPECIES: hypothetical protein [Gordonia]NKY92748.1 hypothetical protein [Gordonia sputi]OBA38479.1 hypothetical protein A5766_04680 [Gordonia sp. 852002-51296_SCH5728562-b]GAB38509.1 hypothetical protein GOSPT_045_01470 [Gordonia sputi NBRC 100414]